MNVAASADSLAIRHGRYLSTSRFVPLDGLRAVAIMLVFLAHLSYSEVWAKVSGGAGVTVFFVISGFIITTLLLREDDRNGRVSLKAFYIRRVFRIYPLYLTVFAAYFLMIVVLGIASAREQLFLNAAPWYLFGFPEIVQLTNVDGQAPFSQAWSIGIEEKFYLVWPLVGFVLLRKRLMPSLLFLFAFGVMFTLIGFGYPVSKVLQPYVQIIFGVLLAFALHHRASFVWISRIFGRAWVANLLALATVACLLLRTISLGHPFYVPYGFLITVTLAAILTAPESGVSRLLSVRPLLFLGMISYSFYLTHGFVLNALEAVLPTRLLNWLDLPVGFPLAVLVAWVSYRLVEKPSIKRGHALAARVAVPAVLRAGS
ncbi:acyltransferase family protein [Microbacterium sp. A84]|uniref:acyltransferase family protein n=1 Tax=Microbacterium sp. A84 TaxID=3450715 RepID=UPI003F41B5F9